MQQQIRLLHLLQRGLERLHQRCRESADKAYRVRQQKIAVRARLYPAHGRIQRRKEHIRLKDLPILGISARVPLYKCVHDSRLARIGISHHRHQRYTHTAALFALRHTLSLDYLQLTAQARQPRIYRTPVDLQLRLALALARHGAGRASLTVLRLPHAYQPRLEILEARQLYLQSRLSAARPPLKYVKYQRRAVHHRHFQYLLEIAYLRRSERVIEDHLLRLQRRRISLDLIDLARAHICRAARPVKLLRHPSHGLHIARLGQLLQLVHGVVKVLLTCVLPARRLPYSREYDPFVLFFLYMLEYQIYHLYDSHMADFVTGMTDKNEPVCV